MKNGPDSRRFHHAVSQCCLFRFSINASALNRLSAWNKLTKTAELAVACSKHLIDRQPGYAVKSRGDRLIEPFGGPIPVFVRTSSWFEALYTVSRILVL